MAVDQPDTAFPVLFVLLDELVRVEARFIVRDITLRIKKEGLLTGGTTLRSVFCVKNLLTNIYCEKQNELKITQEGGT